MSANPDEFIRLDCPRCGAPLQIGEEVLVCEYCRAKLILKRSVQPQQGKPGENARGQGAAVHGLRMQPFSYVDPNTGREVFSVLVPQGWQMQGGVTWVTARPAAPVHIGFQIVNPGGCEVFEVLPNLYFTWTNTQVWPMARPAGSLYFGYEVQPPVDARQTMRQFVLPRYRNIPDLRVVDEGPAAELLNAVTQNQPAQAQGPQTTRDSARVRLSYTLNRQAIAEEMSGVVEYFHTFTPGIFGGTENIIWNVGYLTSFRAAPERLESYNDLYRTLLSSIKVNPAWNEFVQQVIQGLTSNTIRQINQIGALSRQISRNYDEISDMSMRGWQERSAAEDRISEKFSQTIRGVDPYYDPNTGQNVELPSGYTQAWSTPLGEYVLSDDPNFNPTIGSNQSWTPMTPPEQ